MSNRSLTPSRVPLIASITAGAISQVGNNFTNIAIPWYVLATTGSAARMGVVGFVQLVPTVVSSVFGGALVDRAGHKRVAVLADVVSGLSVAAIPLIHETIGLQLWQLLVLVFLGAMIDAPGGSARSAIFPDLVELSGTTLERANGINGIVQNVGQLAVPPLAGISIALLGASQVLWIDAGSFFISALIYWSLAPSVEHVREATGPYWSDAFAGLRFLRASPMLFTLLVFAAFINFLTAPLFGLALAVMARETFGSARSLGWMLGGLGAGSLLSLLVFSAKGHDWSRRKTIVLGLAAGFIPIMIVGMASHVWLAAGALVICGMGLGPINPITSTVLQERTPLEMRGRVFGGVTALALVAAPLGLLVFGTVVERAGAQPTIVGIGAILTLTAFVLGLSPSFRDIDVRPSNVQ